MKQVINIFLIAGILAMTACSATKEAKIQTAVVMTSAQCGMCKTTIEGALKGKDGIKWVVLEPETQKLSVKFDTRKISLDQIRQAVADVGYDADDVKAQVETYNSLPACCKKDGGHH